MSSVERSPSPLMLNKQFSESPPDERSPPSSQLAVPMHLGSVSSSPSPQMKHKKMAVVTEGVCIMYTLVHCVYVMLTHTHAPRHTHARTYARTQRKYCSHLTNLKITYLHAK